MWQSFLLHAKKNKKTGKISGQIRISNNVNDELIEESFITSILCFTCCRSVKWIMIIFIFIFMMLHLLPLQELAGSSSSNLVIK